MNERAAIPDGSSSLLVVRNLRMFLGVDRRTVRAVDGVDLNIDRCERIGLVGESGSGKSMTGRSLVRLLPASVVEINGEVWYAGSNLLDQSEAKMRSVRGREIALVFQDPMTFLNPTMRIGAQIAEVVQLHVGSNRLQEDVDTALFLVGLQPASGIKSRYPHELSGGMRQRVLLAIALACRPKLLIADEPTTALDVTTQAQIMSTLKDLTEKMSMALLLITHDLGLVAELCDRVYIMYAGHIVEVADTFSLFERPAHPYTRGLLAGVLSIEGFKETLTTIPGTVPDLANVPSGCRFRTRCPHVMPKCEQDPPWFENSTGQMVRCWLFEDEAAADTISEWQKLELIDAG